MNATRRAPATRRQAVLVAGLVAIVAWQALFFSNEDSGAGLRADYTLEASGGVLEWQSEFVYFLYYLGLYPVATLSPGPQENSQEGAQRLIDEQGPTLVMDRYWTIRYGDLGKTYLYLPGAWLEGQPADPTMVPANALVMTAALLALFAAFWSIGKVRLGVLLVLLLGSNPFQVYETYAHNNLFGWPIAITILVLALHVPLLRGGWTRFWPTLLVAVATGGILGTVRQVRTEAALVLVAAVGAYLVMGRVRWWKRLVVLIVFGLSLGATSSSWLRHFDAKFREAYSVVSAAGGHTFDGPRQAHHFVWHALWCGLGDFDRKYGYEWADIGAVRYAWPMMRRSGYEPIGHPPIGDKWDELTMGVYWDRGRVYAKTPFESLEYIDVVRAKVLTDIARDPQWYLGILARRVLRLVTDVTPPSLAAGAWNASFPARWAFGLLGALAVPVLVYRKDWFNLKLLAFTVPLIFTPLFVYSGKGAVYYSIFHLVALAVLLDEAWQAAARGEWGFNLRLGNRTLSWPWRAGASATGTTEPAAQPLAGRPWGGRFPRVIGLMALLLVILGAGAWLTLRAVVTAEIGPFPPHETLQLALLPIDNATGDDAFDWLGDELSDRLAAQLDGARGGVLGPAAAGRLLDGENSPNPDLAVRLICDRSGADRAVTGQLLAAENELRACITAFSCSDPDRPIGGSCEPLLAGDIQVVAQRLGSSLRAAFGEPPLPPSDDTAGGPVASDVAALQQYAEAARLERRGEWGMALRAVGQALARAPDLEPARILDARLRSRAGLGWAVAPQVTGPEDPGEGRLEDTIRDLAHPRQAAKGLRVLGAWLDREPGRADLRLDLGRHLIQLEMWSEAERTLAPLVDEPGAPAEAYGLLATLHASHGDLGRGYQILLEQQRRNRNEPLGLSFTVEHLRRWGRLELADDLLDRARVGRIQRGLPAITFDGLLARWRLRVSADRWPDADWLAARIGHLDDPRAAFGGLCLSVSRLRAGRSRFALALAEEAAVRLERETLDPAPALLMAGDILLERGEPAAALEVVRRAQRGGDASRSALQLLFREAEALARLGRWSEATERGRHFAHEVETMPGASGSRWLHHLEGELALLRGEARRAVEALTLAERLLPPRGYCGEHVPIWYALARAHLAAGQDAEAESWFERVIGSTTESLCWPIPYARSSFLLAQLRREQGKTEAAHSHFARFLELWGQGDLALAEQAESRSWVQASRPWPGVGTD